MELESLIGHLSHVAFIIPMYHHFLGQLRRLLHRFKELKGHVCVPDTILEDLNLWLTFLNKASIGILFNLIAERRPSHMFVTDSCENEIGGFSVSSGRAFRHEFPTHLKGREIINVLEHLDMLVAIFNSIVSN